MNPELVAMVGLPRSGKSTYVDDMLSNFDIICADDIRLAMGTQFEPKLEPFVWAIHDTMLRAMMIRKRNIVLDETNTSIKRIDKYYSFCKEYKYNLKLLYINTPINVCLTRNIGEGSVPEEVIYRMDEQLQELMLELYAHPIYTYTKVQ